MESAVEAMKRGAYDYLEKPFNVEELRIVVRKALEALRMKEELRNLRAQTGGTPPPLVGNSPGMLKVFKEIGRIAPRPVTVLILGESGTGKDLVARAIHHNSDRSGGPYIVINSASLPRDLLEAELFGSRKGAFTGADENRPGKLRAAHGGTLFLDEIGEMPLEIQAKLLRVLEDGMVTPLGATLAEYVDVRIIAATNRNLEEAVSKGQFREDLYYRLNVSRIHLPPLRDRPEDIPALAEGFLKKAEARLDLGPKTFGDGVMDFLQKRAWPGNVRELENTIMRTVLLSSGPVVSLAELKSQTLKGREFTLDEFFEERLKGLLGSISRMDRFDLYDTVISEVDRSLISLVLKHSRGNQLQTARILGINRNTLRKKINQLKIKIK